MKTNTVLLAILILFQSCYSYKKVEINNLKIKTAKRYAIKTKVVNGRKRHLKILEITDTHIIIQKRKRRISIPKSNILKVEEMKFSFWRTGTFTILIAIPTLLYIALSNFKLNFGGNWNWGWI